MNGKMQFKAGKEGFPFLEMIKPMASFVTIYLWDMRYLETCFWPRIGRQGPIQNLALRPEEPMPKNSNKE